MSDSLPTNAAGITTHPASVTRLAEIPGQAAAVGPFSHAVIANGFVFTSGQIPAITGLDDQAESFEGQVRQTIENLRTVLEAAGSSLAHVVKVNTYLTSKDQLEEYNRVYTEYFGPAMPARTSVCVSLWGVSLEIECVAVLA
ncbi:RidA family protein [Arthrobacter bambusae]|jgi:2-iminobutanoate/2-iminopropanoate deaminase|uniref:RidA family protein n=1 Tax=Arthrobacter bambusae TaxID=1338426 RepID=UPI0027866AAC|nr:RidA family protein [Arthrobacter bambusae]MDQ0212469.1 2-iminobutanoate/2-iminopropanoate deaminase [Arthrobacter bambusae]MDQ0236917.1 2-iminobutanoate/2-iminopropanoate deaminase [Arthrobacter bambusae]